MSNQDPEGDISTMVVVKWSDNLEGSGDKIEAPLCVLLYKEEGGYLVSWSGTDPDAKMNLSLGTKRRIFGLSHGISTMKSLISDKYLSIMVNSDRRSSGRR